MSLESENSAYSSGHAKESTGAAARDGYQSTVGKFFDRIAHGVMLAPSLLLLCAVFLLPLCVSLFISFYGKAGVQELLPSHFVGLENYSDLIQDQYFTSSVLRTLIYTATSVALEVVIGFLMALALNLEIPGMRWARSVLLAPMMMTPIVASLMWKLMFDPDNGIVNKILPLHITWLGEPVPAFLSLIVVSVWQNAPYVALLLLAGLRTLPTEVMDAAVIDGASRLQRIRYITLPLLAPHLGLAILLRTIFEFRAFENVFVLTGGGPGSSTLLLSLYTYSAAFVSYDLGSSAAAAWVTLAITACVCVFLFIMLRNWRRHAA
jgi:multiple sugar transport system permease protein